MNGADQSRDLTGGERDGTREDNSVPTDESRRVDPHETAVETPVEPMGAAPPNRGVRGPADGDSPGTRARAPRKTHREPVYGASRGPRSYTPRHLAEQILTTKSAIEGERKTVTVMFAEVADFTGMAEALDPEDVHEIMDRCFKIIMDEVHNHRGTINQFTGSGVMALFGAPLALEDHAKKACQAALSIQNALKRLGDAPRERLEWDFKMRVGLNSGPVVVGSIGDDLRMDYTAIGDTTNMAARMKSMAKPGAVQVSENTYKRISRVFQCDALGKVKVKGKTEPQNIYVLKKLAFHREPDLDRRLRPIMVGREKELGRLVLQTLKVVNGEGSIVNIIGEAGIGKSRLTAELKREEMMRQVTVLQGKVISIGRNLSFYPIIDMLKNWAGIHEHDGMAPSREKLKAAIRRVCGEHAEEVFPFAATLMGIRLSGEDAKRVEDIEGEALEKLILKNIRLLLSKASEWKPLVIIVEDLHWADDSSLALLESLYSLAKTRRILFVNIFRPGYLAPDRGVIQATNQEAAMNPVEIALQPLDARNSKNLINNMLDFRQLPQVVKDKIARRSGGNPFFIEEVVRSLIDDGAIVVKDGQWAATAKMDEVDIPYTIKDVLMARIDRLEEKTRSLVKIASVIGRSFFYRIISDVARSIEDVDKRLSYLKDIQFIREQERMEELEYMFKHALAQATAYDSILHQKRKKIHLQVADSITESFAGRLYDFYGVLAYHYSMGENLEKAEIYLTKAGEEALKSSASSEALHYYKNAMELYVKQSGQAHDPDKMAALQQNVAIAFHNKGQYPEAARYFDRALKSLGKKESENALITNVRLVVNILGIIKSLLFPSAGRKIAPTPRDNQIMNIMLWRGCALVYTDIKKMFTSSIEATRGCFKFDIEKLDNGFKTLAGSMTLFSWTGISHRVCGMLSDYIRNNLDWEHDKRNHLLYTLHETVFHFVSGDFDKSVDEELIAYGLKKGDLFSVSSYMIFLGWISIERGDFATAENLVRRLRDISEEYRHENGWGLYYELNLTLLLKKRKLAEASRIVDEGMAHLSRIGEEMRNITMLSMKAVALAMQNDIAGAEEALDEARARKRREGVVPPYYLSNYWMGAFLCNALNLKRAIKDKDKAKIREYQSAGVKIAKKARKNCRKVASARTSVYRLTGNFYWMIGKQKTALKWWDKSIATGECLGARLECSRARASVGRRLSGPESDYNELNGIEAGDYLKKGLAMLEEMDLRWDLAQSDEEIWS
ncbi:MAG: AAA family ATPase [Desulfobacterales bacterium]|nr:AAA family ATPase [Desulfobacterales bacterium]